MKMVKLSSSNIEQEHICCAINSKTTEEGVGAKKLWLQDRMEEGLVFNKMDMRGKVFIEYIPAEYAWLPIVADGYMIINCFWVSGSYKGHGYGKELLETCEKEARELGKKGVAVIVGNKKRPFLSDKSFMLKQGYEITDTCAPFMEIVAKQFEKDDEYPLPKFKDCARQGLGEGIKGVDIFYTAQCPFTVPYSKIYESLAMQLDYPVRLHQIATREMAQNHLAPITTFSVFIDGVFKTNEMPSPQRFAEFIEKWR